MTSEKGTLSQILEKLELLSSPKADVSIELVRNGAKVNFPEGSQVYKFDEDEPEGIVEMFYDILGVLSNGSRYSAKRVQVGVFHGDKFECPSPKECSVCGPEFKL